MNFLRENRVLDSCKMCGQNVQFLNDEAGGTSLPFKAYWSRDAPTV